MSKIIYFELNERQARLLIKVLKNQIKTESSARVKEESRVALELLLSIVGTYSEQTTEI